MSHSFPVVNKALREKFRGIFSIRLLLKEGRGFFLSFSILARDAKMNKYTECGKVNDAMMNRTLLGLSSLAFIVRKNGASGEDNITWGKRGNTNNDSSFLSFSNVFYFLLWWYFGIIWMLAGSWESNSRVESVMNCSWGDRWESLITIQYFDCL